MVLGLAGLPTALEQTLVMISSLTACLVRDVPTEIVFKGAAEGAVVFIAPRRPSVLALVVSAAHSTAARSLAFPHPRRDPFNHSRDVTAYEYH